MRRTLRAAQLAALWILLGGWIGALSLFAAVVAPTAFQVLPSSELAGRLVGPVLAALHLYGAAAGLAIAALTFTLGRGIALALPALLLSVLCLVSHFGVTAAIAELREAAFGAAPEAAAQLRWARLHRVSVALYGATGIGALILAVLHARSQVGSRGERSDG